MLNNFMTELPLIPIARYAVFKSR